MWHEVTINWILQKRGILPVLRCSAITLLLFASILSTIASSGGGGGGPAPSTPGKPSGEAPSIVVGSDFTASEGEAVDVAAFFSDPNTEDTHSAQIDWGDGVVDSGTISGNIITGTHSYNDNGTYAVTVTVSDDKFNSSSDSLQIAVENVAPVVNAGPNISAMPGISVDIKAFYSDTGVADTHAAMVDWGDGTQQAGTVSSDTVTGSHSYSAPVNYSLNVTVTDDDGASTSDAVLVQNAAATLNINAGSDIAVNEGETVNLTALFSDPDNTATHSATIDWGDGVQEAGVVSGHRVTGAHNYTDDSTYTVTVSISNSNLNSDSDTVLISVHNVAPRINAGFDQTANEGDNVSIAALFIDPGTADTHTAIIDWGDGVATAGSISGNTVTASHAYDDGTNTYIATVSVVDDDGAVAGDTVQMTVNNVSPTIVLSGATTVDEGTLYTLTLGAVTDPGEDIVTTYRVDWDDGFNQEFSSNGPVTHTYADGSNAYTISVELADEDGNYTGAGSLALTVENVAPTITLSGAASVNIGTPYALILGAVNDSGDDTVTNYRVNWGDGFTQDFTSNGPVSHTYTGDTTSYTITVDLTDEDGAYVGAGSHTVQVVSIPTIALSGAATVDEGSQYTLTLGALSNGAGHTISTYRVHWGDGKSDDYSATGAVTHTYSDGINSYSITVDLVDSEHGVHVNAGTLNVGVANVTPSINLSGNAAVDEGTLYTLILGTVTDPGDDTVTTYQVDWGDGLTQDFDSNGPVTHTYADGTNAYNIAVNLVDEDGTHTGAGSLALTVSNVAPTITLSGEASVNAGSPYTLTLGAVNDTGADTVTIYRVNWGDGTTQNYSSNGPVSHTYTGATASYTITVDLTDEDGTHLSAGTHLLQVIAPPKWSTPSLTDYIDWGGNVSYPPEVAMDNNGNILVAWHGTGIDGIQVYVSHFIDNNWVYPANDTQHISVAGQNTNTNTPPYVAMGDNGDAIVVWQQLDNSSDCSGSACSQVFKAEYRSGNWIGPISLSDHVSLDGTNAISPHVAMDDNGNTIVVWSQSDGVSTNRIYKSEYRNSQWSEPGDLSESISPSGGTVFEPQVAMDNNGNAIVVWPQFDGSYEQIYKSEFRNDGWNIPSDLSDNISPDGSDAGHPKMAMDDNGNAIVVWDQFDPSTDLSVIMMSEYRGSSWSTPALENKISPSGSDVATASTDVAMDNNGEATIVWGQEWDGLVRVFLSEYRNGGWIHPATTASYISPLNGQIAGPVVSMDDNGDAVITWRQRNVAGDAVDMITLGEFRNDSWSLPSIDDIISPTGSFPGADRPNTAMSNNGTAIIVWRQHDGTSYRIYKSEYR